MNTFTTLASKIIPVLMNDVDTDQIIPAQYLKVTDKAGLAKGLFQSWRTLPDGTSNPDFPLNQGVYQGAQVLLAGDNFGCGSSREHAPWALMGWGIRAIISTSFADIFRNNSLKNGLLPIVVSQDTHQYLAEKVQAVPGSAVYIDLATQTLYMPGGRQAWFPIDPFNKACLLDGVDQLGYILRQESLIEAFETRRGDPAPGVAQGVGV